MRIQIGFTWTKALAGRPDARTLVLQVRELMQRFDVPRLFIPWLDDPTEVVPSAQSLSIFADSMRTWDGPGDILELFAEPVTRPADHRDEEMELGAFYEEARRNRPIAYPTWFSGLAPLCSHERVIEQTERFLHLTAPSIVRVSLPKGPPSMIYLDAEHARIAESLRLGLTHPRGTLGGGWYRAHGEPLESTSPVASAANRAMRLALLRLRRARETAEKAKWMALQDEVSR